MQGACKPHVLGVLATLLGCPKRATLPKRWPCPATKKGVSHAARPFLNAPLDASGSAAQRNHVLLRPTRREPSRSPKLLQNLRPRRSTIIREPTESRRSNSPGPGTAQREFRDHLPEGQISWIGSGQTNADLDSLRSRRPWLWRGTAPIRSTFLASRTSVVGAMASSYRWIVGMLQLR
jgi:hypothetical protein